MAYQLESVPMTFSHLQIHACITSLFKWDFSYSYAVADRISNDIERRAVPLRQLSFL